MHRIERGGEGARHIVIALLLWACIPASLEGPDAVTGNMNIMLFSRIKTAPPPPSYLGEGGPLYGKREHQMI
jgi:hypothetical protein